MKVIYLITALIVFAVGTLAQDKLPVIKSNVSPISIHDGEQLKKNYWRLVPEAKPDIYKAELIYGKPHKVTFITDVDRISFTVEEGKTYDFIIDWNGKLCHQQIVGTNFTPAAVFDKKYQAAHRGKVFVLIPEVYELVNIVLALTPRGIADEDMVYHDSDYYKRMRQWFDKYQNHPLIAEFEAAIKKNFFNYFNLKMNGYAFEFDKSGRIVQSKVYDRTGFRGEGTNSLRPYLEQLQSFSDQTNFREFFKENRKTYDEQIRFYRNEANVAEMKRWLDKNFPVSNDYDTYKIIFSPLVYGSQSTTWIESNGFKELQPHVNFPYPPNKARFSPQGEIIFRGNVVFTEINHGYINPETDKYADRVSKAISNRKKWADEKLSAANYGGNSLFNEYMNWGLVSLRITDYVPKGEQEKMISLIDEMMTKRRGFPMFTEFDSFLVDLYRSRKPNQTIADLYPQIIEWFEKNN